MHFRFNLGFGIRIARTAQTIIHLSNRLNKDVIIANSYDYC